MPTPIQTAAIPAVHDGRDLLAAAQTGTGKTAAFALPLLQRLDAEQPNPRRLAGSPPARARRRLASRRAGAAVLRDFGRHLQQRTIAVVFGGVSPAPAARRRCARRRHHRRHARPPARPHQGAGGGPANVRHLVLDEADRMLDMGFIRDIRRVLAVLPSSARTCSSPRRCRTRSARSQRACWTIRSPSKSRRATRPPSSSSIACTWSSRARSGRC